MKPSHSAALAAYDAREASGLLIGGIDEVGRGPLFGPVTAACVVLRAGEDIPGVDDSKKLSPQKREQLFAEIIKQAVSVGVGMADVSEIDAHNILGATRLAMMRAAAQAGCADVYFVDAVGGLVLPAPQRAIVRGDALSLAIAAASIIAKVTRDALMRELDARYPGYGIASHKGYGTPEHIAALRALGPTPEHRMGFLGRILAS